MKNSPENHTAKITAPKRLDFSFFFVFASLIIIYISIFNISKYDRLYKNVGNREYEKNYFETELLNEGDFNREFIRYAKNVNLYYTEYRNFDELSDSDKLTKDDLSDAVSLLQQNFYGSEQRAVDTFNNVIFNMDADETQRQDAKAELDDTLEKLIEAYDRDFANEKEKKLKEKIGYYENIDSYLKETNEFNYYIYDTVLDKPFTNIPIHETVIEDYILSKTYLAVNLADIPGTLNGENLNSNFRRNGLKGYIMVPKNQPAGSQILPSIEYADNMVQSLGKIYKISLIKYYAASAVAAIILIAVVINAYKNACKTLKENICFLFKLYLKLPCFIKTLLFIFSVAFLIYSAYPSLDIFEYGGASVFYVCRYLFKMLFSLLFISLSVLYTVYLFKDLRRFKNELEYKMIVKFFKNLRIIRAYSPFVLTFLWLLLFFISLIIIVLGGYIIMNSGYYLESLSFTLTTVFICILLFIVMDIISCFSKLGYYIGLISNGSIIEIPNETTIFASPINKLNKLSEGLYSSLEETLKSERTKTELITNVSHDLKTPLTSIINYVDLLSRVPALPKDAKEYIEVLKQKSNRLKILIDDLFEAAKLSSHSMELAVEPVDIIQLLEQSVGELSEKLIEKGLIAKISSNTDKTILLLDGKRMWRVFENLLNNIIKYAPPDTRVYINTQESAENVEIIFRNISNHELSFDASELFDRFKRGDVSRTTEGSGLGLSIAKNIIDLHGGKMDIVIDGDLFKVIIVLNKQI